jgi:hypothetical protein
MNYPLYLLFLANLAAAYLYGHKRGLREGIAIGKSLMLPSPTPELNQSREVILPSSLSSSDVQPPPDTRDRPILEPSDSLLILGKYSILRNGMILRGSVELAYTSGESPFEFDLLPDVQKLKDDDYHCRKLSRLWVEAFGVDEGTAITLDGYWVSKTGLFWKGDLLLGRVERGGFHRFNRVNQYYGDPTPEDIEKCDQLYDLWAAEFLTQPRD